MPFGKHANVNKMFKKLQTNTNVTTNKYKCFPYIYDKLFYTCECGIKDFTKDKVIYKTILGKLRT
jgi:hypothetical protein